MQDALEFAEEYTPTAIEQCPILKLVKLYEEKTAKQRCTA